MLTIFRSKNVKKIYDVIIVLLVFILRHINKYKKLILDVFFNQQERWLVNQFRNDVLSCNAEVDRDC